MATFVKAVFLAFAVVGSPVSAKEFELLEQLTIPCAPISAETPLPGRSAPR